MGLSGGAVKLCLELWQRGYFKKIDSVIEMGSQELHITKTDFKNLVKSAGITDFDEKTVPNLGNWPDHPRTSAKAFYELLGAEEYAAIDMNGEHHSVPHDLNTPMTDESMLGKFDLVTDHCANSHVFNTAEAYRTIHRLCKPGGLITLLTPVYGSNGYFNFDLSFYEGMAAANSYRIAFSSFVVSLKRQYLTAEERMTIPADADGTLIDEHHIPLSNDLLNTVDWSKDRPSLSICYVFEKQSDEDFQFPYQGEFMARELGNYGYELQFLATPPSRSYIPIRADSSERLLESFPVRSLARHVLRRIGRKVSGRRSR